MGIPPELLPPPVSAEQRSVRRARVAAVASIFIAFFGSLAGLSVQFEDVGPQGGLFFAVIMTPFATLLPVLMNLFALSNLRSKPKKYRPGRAAVAAWAGFVIGLLIGLLELRRMVAERDWGEWELAALSIPFAFGQLALALFATKARRSMTPGPAQKPRRAIRERVSLAVLFGVLAVLSVSVWMQIWHTHPAGDGPTPIASLRTINTALATYATTYGNGYPSSLKILGPPAKGAQASCLAADLIWEGLAGGLRGGYRFHYKPGTPHRPQKGEPSPPATAGCPEGVDTYTVTANRVKSHRYHWRRNFFTDESGVIRATDEDRPATAQDPPIGG